MESAVPQEGAASVGLGAWAEAARMAGKVQDVHDVAAVEEAEEGWRDGVQGAAYVVRGQAGESQQ